MRQRAIAAAAGLSGSLAAFCLTTALASGEAAPLGGFMAGAVAAAALVLAARRGRQDQAALRVGPQGTVWLDCGSAGETQLRPVGITRNLICLARSGPGSPARAVWRDSVSPDGFRRIAAYGLWQRGTLADRAESFELIVREAVTGGQWVPRTGRPRGQ
ncbi:MAG TPA: hypothetical protein VMQ45_16075 [Burkholderiaceae bacterium]|nr:hypothetical protein [Burkholderiaceae bacterium]